MNNFNLIIKDCEYKISEANLLYLENEEVVDFEVKDVINLLNEGKEKVNFDYEYYSDNCEDCNEGVIINKCFRFLEYHFYIFTKDNKYFMSNLSKEYEETSFVKLLKGKKVDNSYIVVIVLCEKCGKYYVEIEQCEM